MIVLKTAARALGLIAALGALSSIAIADAAKGPLRVGTNAGFAPPIEAAVAVAKAQGLDVKLIEFTDPVTPNTSLANGEIDLNYFQHKPFLDVVKAARGFDLEPVGIGIANKTGLFSKKYKSLSELPVGARVALAGDPFNFGRGLELLEAAGLIKLKPDHGPQVNVDAVIDNPKKLKFLEIDFHQLPQSLNEVDLAHGYTHFLKASGVIDPHAALFWEPINPRYGIVFVAQPKNKDDPRIAQFIKIYQTSPEVRAVLDKQYGDLYVRLWERE
ncbi:MetQ/NlpA family ABC transporter substrate-binding protein [Rhodopseudomonas palustris]|uniref:MetQ/NlpA family ABC transporter substrate-binding protein n=1 Tax=Rhodopseudomonas palustris TaxID=1076 RepID=UPI000CEC1E3C|nr:MetQ/NlpA family ABC transporter substrate-binding protein [Rhodopseudomonas palustris]PPQ42308.1 methionine ABC transporter substrate-binding protein [Rhodopseudomonas palustris]QLH71412.1 ABC transporter substrate-binding protein [Rhodopseudomonas palustris]RHZ91436.1 MetQ/NlpA family ABC transporter substrate-binding protein [Rhodopseudomonas palustris]